jgi:hypothetical protein
MMLSSQRVPVGSAQPGILDEGKKADYMKGTKRGKVILVNIGNYNTEQGSIGQLP